MATGCSNGEPSELKGWYLEFSKIPILKEEDVLCIYIDVVMVLLALVELLKITLMIIEKCKRH